MLYFVTHIYAAPNKAFSGSSRTMPAGGRYACSSTAHTGTTLHWTRRLASLGAAPFWLLAFGPWMDGFHAFDSAGRIKSHG